MPSICSGVVPVKRSSVVCYTSRCNHQPWQDPGENAGFAFEPSMISETFFALQQSTHMLSGVLRFEPATLRFEPGFLRTESVAPQTAFGVPQTGLAILPIAPEDSRMSHATPPRRSSLVSYRLWRKPLRNLDRPSSRIGSQHTSRNIRPLGRLNHICLADFDILIEYAPLDAVDMRRFLGREYLIV